SSNSEGLRLDCLVPIRNGPSDRAGLSFVKALLLYFYLCMAFRFEFDPANKILLMRFEGLVTDESLAESYTAIRKYSIKTDARAGIWDFSSVTEHGESGEIIRELAIQEPAMPHPTRPRF